MRGFAVFCVYAGIAVLALACVFAIFFCHNAYQSGATIVMGVCVSFLVAGYGLDRLENE